MWRKLKSKLIQVKRAVGIEIIQLPNDQRMINAVLVAVQGTAIRKEQEWSSLASLDELAAKIPAKIPVTVVLNGKGVLVKMLEAAKASANTVTDVLPQSNPAEFYVITLAQHEQLLAGIARKDLTDSILAELNNKGFRVLDAGIGISQLGSLIPFISAGGSGTIDTPCYRIRYNNSHNISTVESADPQLFNPFEQPEYTISGQYIRSSLLVAFAAAVRLLAGNLEEPATLRNTTVETQRTEYRYYNYFSAALWALLVSIFALLLINFIAYNHYFNKNKELLAAQTLSQEQVLLSRQQQKELARKEQFLQETGWLQASRTSFFADRIASLVPGNCQLTALHFFPARDASVLERSGIPFKTDTIQLAGSCTDPLVLNQFTNNLKNLAGIKEVQVKNYQYKKETESGAFFIEIITH